MAKTVSDAEMKAFRKKKRDARKRLNAMLAAGQITGPEFNKRVSALTSLKVGQAIPASITKPSKPSAAAAASAGNKKPSMTLPVAPPAGRNKKKPSGSTSSMPKTLPKPKPKRPPKEEKLYTTISPVTGMVLKKKVPLKQHLANLDAAKKKGLPIGSEKTKASRAKAAKDLEAMIKKLVRKK